MPPNIQHRRKQVVQREQLDSIDEWLNSADPGKWQFLQRKWPQRRMTHTQRTVASRIGLTYRGQSKAKSYICRLTWRQEISRQRTIELRLNQLSAIYTSRNSVIIASVYQRSVFCSSCAWGESDKTPKWLTLRTVWQDCTGCEAIKQRITSSDYIFHTLAYWCWFYIRRITFSRLFE